VRRKRARASTRAAYATSAEEENQIAGAIVASEPTEKLYILAGLVRLLASNRIAKTFC